MDSRNLVLSLLLIVLGCRDDPNAGSIGVDSMFSRKQVIEIAERFVREIELDRQGRLKARFDDGNREWQRILKELEQEEPEAAKVHHEQLDGRDYQAIHIAHDPPSIGGTFWICVDKNTGEVIMYAIGL